MSFVVLNDYKKELQTLLSIVVKKKLFCDSHSMNSISNNVNLVCVTFQRGMKRIKNYLTFTQIIHLTCLHFAYEMVLNEQGQEEETCF